MVYKCFGGRKSRIFSPAVAVAMILVLSSHALHSPDARHSTG